MRKRKFPGHNELEFFNNVEIPKKENNKLEHIALAIILVSVGICAYMTFVLYQLEKISN
jgi:hypothetical protein